MLREILGEEGCRRFREETFGRAPFARPREARALCHLLSWEVLVGLALRTPERDLLLVKNGRLRADRVPRTAEEVGALHRAGYSVVLRNVDRLDEALAALAHGLAEEIGMDAAVQLYATPASRHGFGWHYDAEEVFIVQTGGAKDYYLRENTVNPRPRIDAMPRDMEYGRETSPVMASTLIAGDWLYIPSGWWHVARAREDSLSISIGALPGG